MTLVHSEIESSQASNILDKVSGDVGKAENNGRHKRSMNLPANRRLIGAIAIIASSLIATAVPFLYLAPPVANTVNNGDQPGNSDKTSTNTNATTSSSSSGSSGSTNNPESGTGSTPGSGHDKGGDKHNPHTGPSQHHGNGHAYAYGHAKNEDQGKAGSNGRHLGAIIGSHGQGSSHSSVHGKGR